ncbi:hypothetical protein BD324DRAFT_641787 [Kockovaella imperatae]|uniref:DUF7727 domain-containing protein n=1 Tax=Kockovaella imperatae TaxID=4999 RepID=A0A1Y1UHU0_9TREE|nr:hypothetical protein BD324DRAFT_641787 [Kockovaella imperatae]ORX37608.1 hypothetical protein BD324DRAFT_641787 [Kockovaella imperatae]
MGRLCWNEWGRLLALVAGTCERNPTYSIVRDGVDNPSADMTWGSIWAIMYRKFFWDMIGGTLGPAGIIPGNNTKFFVTIVVNLPVLQIINLLIGLVTLALEWPLPLIDGTALHRSLVFRMAFYFFSGFLGIMVYQTVDCAIYYVIVSAVFTRAMILGERILSTKAVPQSIA